jgi:hypothetical protein
MILSILILTQVALAQATPAAEAFKKEYVPLQKAVEATVSSSVPGSQILQNAKATYLEEFGVVIALEVMLEAPPGPFEVTPKPRDQIRTSMLSHRKVLQEKLEMLLKQKAATLQSVGDAQSLVLVVHLFNPSNVPNFPTQIILTVKKQDPTKVIVREF